MAEPKLVYHDTKSDNPSGIQYHDGSTPVASSSGRESGFDIAKDTAVSTGLGAGIGALTPEILTGAGMALEAGAPFAGLAFPAVEGLGIALTAGGQLARGARGAEALSTGLISGASTLGGKLTPRPETPVSIPGTPFAVPRGSLVENTIGLGAPLVGAGAKSLITHSPVIKDAVAFFKQQTGKSDYAEAASRELANFRNTSKLNNLFQFNKPSVRLSEQETQSYRDLFSTLQRKDEATQNAVLGSISTAQKNADAIRQDAALRAQKVLSTNKLQAQVIVNEGENKAKGIIDKAVDDAYRKLGIARRAESAGRKASGASGITYSAIGDANVTQAQSGQRLQGLVVDNLSKEQAAISGEYKRAKELINQKVKAKEAQGISIYSTQAYKTLEDFFDKQLIKGKYRKSTQFAPVTEPGLRGVYEKIEKAIKEQKIFDGIDTQGNPVFRDVPTSFEAIDHVRRKVGEVFNGKQVEGYDGLLHEQARDLYAALRRIQTEYTDGEYAKVLENYAEGKGAVNQYGIPVGKKITKTDTLNPEYLTYDPSGLPGEFFSTRKKTQDLLNLVKDPALVESEASNYVARQLKDKDAKAVEKYAYDNKEWLDLFPSLQAKIKAHSDALTRAGSVVPKTQSLSESLRTEVKALPGVSQKEAAKARVEAAKAAKESEDNARKEAKDIIKEGEAKSKQLSASAAKAKSLLGTGDPVKEIEKLITGGQTQRLEQIAPLIKEDPESMRQFNEALRITLSRENPAGIYDKWERTIKPALLNTGSIERSEAESISKRIGMVQYMLAPNEAVQTMISMIRQGMTAAAVR